MHLNIHITYGAYVHEMIFEIFFSLIGGVLIVVGLYMVLWGQNKELQMTTQLEAEHIEGANTMGTWRALEGDAR